MTQQFNQQSAFIGAIAFYLLGVLFYCYFEFRHERKVNLQAIDEQLLISVNLTQNLLQQELKDNILGDKPLTLDEDFLLSLKLQKLAEELQVAYLYHLIQVDQDIAFISSNPAVDELDNLESYEAAFMMDYEEAPPTLYEAFVTGEIRYSQYKDRWGHFRSVFFPLEMANGRITVIGVDVNIDALDKAAFSALLKALVYGLLLGLLIFPLVCVYLKAIRQNYRERLLASQLHPITGLPNRRSLEKVLQKSDSRSDQLLLIEIENFDRITSLLDTTATDNFILKLAYCLKDMKVSGAEHCQLFHFDDSTFALYSDHDFSEQQVREIIAESFKTLIDFDAQANGDSLKLPLVVRMGSARHQDDPITLASMALMHAKNTNQSLVDYDSSLNLPEHYQRYIRVFNLLSDALKHDRVKVYFQPILDYHSGQVVKYEALARIFDEQGQLVSSPDEFMPIAYQSRLCHKLTRVVLSKTLEAIRSTPYIVSINLSIKDLFDRKTREHIIRAIRESGDGSQIHFELLEQQVIGNYRLAAAYIKQLKSCVGQIGLDDLGKLYSNFDRLLGLPLDFVKIDGMVIEASERDSDARAIVEGVINFAHRKGIKSIAEHCATESICEMVAMMDVDMMQGFYIGMPSEQFTPGTFTSIDRQYQASIH